MKKELFAAAVAALLMTSTAMAADLGVITQPAPAGFEATWTGFYAGIFAGVGGGNSSLTIDAGFPPPLEFTGRNSGGIAGVQIGADYQVGDFVVGGVADIALSNIAADSGLTPPLGFQYQSELNYLGTLRARVGFLPTDNLLTYVHGGLAYGQTSPSVSLGGFPGPAFDDVNRVGYTIGAGLEYKVTNNISVQAEYAYTNLGNQSVDAPAGLPPGVSINEAYDFHTVKAGVNYRF